MKHLLSSCSLLLSGLLVAGLGSLPARAAGDQVLTFEGICDASAVVPLSETHQVVADDEDNVLRIYDRTRGGPPVWTLDLSRFLQVDPQEPEVDIEAAARVGDRIYWISSHGRNRKGRLRPSRHRFFATEIVPGPGHPMLRPVGTAYRGLLADLLRDPRLATTGLAAAAALPPKSKGALSIEGMVAQPDGRLLVGFRNPQPQGRALVVPLENPAGVIAGERARLGDPHLLDLAQRGVRGMGARGDRVVMVVGAHDQASRSEVVEWQPASGAVRVLRQGWPGGFNPEAIEALPDEPGVAWLVVSDDGGVKIGGRDCKQLKDASRKRFRALVWWESVEPGDSGGSAAASP